MMRALVTVVLLGPALAFWARGLDRAYRTRTLTNRWGKFRRHENPFNYWLGWCLSAFVFAVFALATAVAVVMFALGK